MSPEIIQKKGHTYTTDFWCLGILIYDMLIGSTPYTAENRQDTIDKILKSRLKFPRHITKNAQDLIKKLLRRTVSQRIGYNNGVKEIKEHSFFDDINWEQALNKKVSFFSLITRGVNDIEEKGTLLPKFLCLILIAGFQLKPPFLPNQSKIDGYFDPQFTELPPTDTPSTSFSNDFYDPFENFNYTSPIFSSHNRSNNARSKEDEHIQNSPTSKLLTSSLKNWSFDPISSLPN